LFSAQLGMAHFRRAELKPVFGQKLPYENYTLRPISLQIFTDFRISGALYEPKAAGPHPGFLMAHGHFGEGKSSGEAQAPAHALAAQGYVVLALDTPGVEEGDRPNRQIHFEAGAANRSHIEASGSTAMALQLHGLQAGLDYLESREDTPWVAAGGASGGAVQAFYLAQIDPRPKALVLASFVPMPRVERTGGCGCDWLPLGWPSNLVTALEIPSLWMSEGAEKAPKGLGALGRFLTLAGPHGFERPMIEETVSWLGTLHRLATPRALPEHLPHAPATTLASQDIGGAGIQDVVWTTPQKASE
jgi:hypothetical protein